MGGSIVRRPDGVGSDVARVLREGDPTDLVVRREGDLSLAGTRLPDEERRRMSTRAVVGDVHTVTRHGMRALLERCGTVDVVAEASSAAEVIQVVRAQVADLAVLGFDLSDQRALQTLRRIKHEAPFTRVLVLSASTAEADVVQAILAGASGYLSKSADPREFKAAVDALRAGGTYLDAGSSVSLRSSLDRASSKGRSRPRVGDLTDRETEIARRVAKGLTARRIGSELGISDRTVNTHIGSLYRRLGVNNRVDAVRELMRLGITPSPR